MKRITQWLALASVAGLCMSVGNVMAQDTGGPGGPGRAGGQGGPGGQGGFGGRGNFDPAQMQQRMMEGVRDRLEITDDTEWQAVEPLVQKVMEVRRDQMGGMGRGFFGGRNRGGGQSNRPRFGSEPSPAETALSDAIESGASSDELKTKMAAYRKVRAEKEAELKAAQDNLKKVLTVKQEAVALQMGLVN